MKDFKKICLVLDEIFERNKDDISISQYQSYLGLRDAIGDKFKELSSEDIKYFTFLCVEKSGVGINIYEFSAAIATAIYIDNVITLDKLETISSDYIIECYEDERIDRIGNYEEDMGNEYDDIRL